MAGETRILKGFAFAFAPARFRQLGFLILFLFWLVLIYIPACHSFIIVEDKILMYYNKHKKHCFLNTEKRVQNMTHRVFLTQLGVFEMSSYAEGKTKEKTENKNRKNQCSFVVCYPFLRCSTNHIFINRLTKKLKRRGEKL